MRSQICPSPVRASGSKLKSGLNLLPPFPGLFQTHAHVVAVGGKDLDGHGLVIAFRLQRLHDFPDGHVPRAQRQMLVSPAQIVGQMDMADAIEKRTDEIEGPVGVSPDVGMTYIQSEHELRIPFEQLGKFPCLDQVVGFGKEIFQTDHDVQCGRGFHEDVQTLFGQSPGKLRIQEPQAEKKAGMKNNSLNS